MIPQVAQVKNLHYEHAEIVSFDIEVSDVESYLPGQFNMLYAFAIGEVPISISKIDKEKSLLTHTIRNVGAVTRALFNLKEGDSIGFRGPFGRGWPLDFARDRSIWFIAGGIGLAPLRPAIDRYVHENGKSGVEHRLFYGVRSDQDLIFDQSFESWKADDLNIQITADRAGPDWPHSIGVVTRLFDGLAAPEDGYALICGPEIMMKYAIDSLLGKGFASERIFVTMERNMQCAIGHCGHCQMGKEFICKDGPVYAYQDLAPIFHEREI